MLVWHFFHHFIFSRRAGSLVRRISWLAITAITLSVTAFFLVLFVMNGMNKSIHSRLMALEPHLYVTVPEVTQTSLLEIHPVFQRLRENPQNKSYVFETQDIIVRTMEGQFRGATARGVSLDSLKFMLNQLKNLEQMQRYRNQTMSSAFAWEQDEVPGEGEIVMGVDLARTLGVFEGDMVTLIPPENLLLPAGQAPTYEKVRIKKIIATNLTDIDAQYLFYQRGAGLQRLSQSLSIQRGIEVWTPDGSNIQGLQENLEKFDGVKVENWMQRNSALFYALKLEKISIGTFLSLAGLIAGSSIVSVLALLLSQKKRDIAILRTIGLSGQKTVKIFTQLGMCLAGVGILAGTVLGVGSSFYIEKNPINILPEIYYDSQIPANVDFALVFWVLFISAILSIAGCWIPARAALDVEPSQALRVKN